ncbi:MAG TPA: hypothetical protein VFK04_04100 [Gemmatimonadaceae bacterium]|nr:hypothetical protein [Gemmatimonadaceae bacterium]
MASNDLTETLVRIRDGLNDAEHAIRQHPAATLAVYESNLAMLGRASFEWATADVPSLRMEDAAMIDRYMLAMAFISAWYHLHGDKPRRDTAAQSAAILVSAVGLEGVFVFKALLYYEREWRKLLRGAGIGSKAGAGCAAVVLLATAEGMIWLALAK